MNLQKGLVKVRENGTLVRRAPAPKKRVTLKTAFENDFESDMMGDFPSPVLSPKEMMELKSKLYNMAPDASPQEILVDSITKVAILYNKIAGSITDDDILKMSAKDKILALQKLAHIHEVTKNSKVKSLTFNKINVFSAGKDELEQALTESLNE